MIQLILAAIGGYFLADAVMGEEETLKMAEGGEISKTFSLMYFKEMTNRQGERISIMRDSDLETGTLMQVLQKANRNMYPTDVYVAINDRKAGGWAAKLLKDGKAVIMAEGYGLPKGELVLEEEVIKEKEKEPKKKLFGIFKDGGDINPDSREVKKYFGQNGSVGGLLVGKRHSEGGIQAKVKSTGQSIEMEGGDVVITRGAVSSPKKYNFEGKEMTGREILSDINVKGGGVAFKKGGKVQDKDKWIQDAVKNKGALRKTAKREGLIKGDEKLSMTDLKKLEKKGGKTAKRAYLAETLKKMK